MAEFRAETDSLGSVQVPAERLWGAGTQRALANFQIGSERMPSELIGALALVKLAAATVHERLGVMDAEVAHAIVQAAREVRSGALASEFPLVIWQTGSGTQTNMNMNEVLANRASELLGGIRGVGRKVHPNDDVNRGHSSNDAFPTAMSIAAVLLIEGKLLPSVRGLRATLAERSASFADVVKIGRTHLQDAVPLTLGQEISGWVAQLDHGLAHIGQSLPHLSELALGGSAVGTGLNTHPEFAVAVAAALVPGAIGDATWLAAPALAVVLAVWLDGLDRRPESWLAALTVLVVGALLALDCVHFPVKWLEPALGADAAFPAALSRAGRLAVGALVLAPVALSAVLLVAPSSLGVGRGRAIAAVASLGGAGLALLFYPALLEARSPGSAFGAFERLGGEQAELGVLGVSPDAARLALGREAVPLSGAAQAADWLRGSPRRRFVVLARKELPALNAASRGLGLGNLPVVHAGAGEVLLASGQLGGERQENPLAALLPAEPPALARPVSAELGGVVELLGWELLDAESRERLVTMESSAPATLRTCWRVRAPLASLGPGDWTFLVHVDGPGIRANADHAPLGGEYATSLWSPGDVLCDEAELTLDPSFVPGDYELFLGLFRGLRRLPLSAGPSDEDRVAAGTVAVR